MQNFLLYTLLCLNRSLLSEDSNTALDTRPNLVKDILAYIHAHLTEDLSLDGIAAHFFKNKFYLAKLFKSELNISFYRYVLKQRLALCVQQVSTGSSLQLAAVNSGFADYSAFYRAFVKEYGVKPSQYFAGIES